ncbi:hypothetical protein [Leptospira vanthielii]|uniref:Uncharacterized protein n=1 Tax=Leptospira vanthielii serovar Holland str. Waz Holland = ATCC 700522 TaxID=1218591 RepID=N1W3Z0_9LEPT|nr:hypothetical protein [Leptospira vanthielii]EMY70959.1 hypothetical protein LEP1GSC199_0366 [Leptospira vanthielii serovar Holland str. Waz Holland = ATCC 700522]
MPRNALVVNPASISNFLWYNEPTHVVRPTVNLTATTTKKFIQEDKAYKY